VDRPYRGLLGASDWAMQMEALLEEKELWNIVKGTEPVSTSGLNSKAMKSYIYLKRESCKGKNHPSS
jgi:hypothetical protein